MGRLKRSLTPKKLLGIVRTWAVPVAIAIALVVTMNFGFANPEPSVDELTAYLQSNKLQVGSETRGDFQQVYYLFNNEKFFLTQDNNNHATVHSSGRYITWVARIGDGPAQVFLYDILLKNLLQVSTYSSNSNPSIDGTHIAWEKWVNEKWQIYYYDGINASPISGDTYSSTMPRIRGSSLAYTQYVFDDPGGNFWHVISYDTNTGQSQTVVATNDAAKAYPHFDQNGTLLTDIDINYFNE